MTKPLKASYETNLAVAKAAWIKSRMHRNNMVERYVSREANSGMCDWVAFEPTTCWDDAMEALKLYLARPDVESYKCIYELRRILFGCEHGYPSENTIPKLVQYGPLALCEAILATADAAREREEDR